jgi:hypothetical protein
MFQLPKVRPWGQQLFPEARLFKMFRKPQNQRMYQVRKSNVQIVKSPTLPILKTVMRELNETD